MPSGRACKQSGRVGGGQACSHTYCCGKTQGLDMLHNFSHIYIYSADTFFFQSDSFEEVKKKKVTNIKQRTKQAKRKYQ